MSPKWPRRWFLLSMAVLSLEVGCTSGSPLPSYAGDPVGDEINTGDGHGGDGGTCGRTFPTADRARVLVVAHPYDELGDSRADWEVFAVSTTGVVSNTGILFTMGAISDGNVDFTPDGKVGIATQEDGTLGVFAVDDDGNVTVTHANFSGGFWAETLEVGPTGEFVYVVDTNWANNGGGIYRVTIECDGTLSDVLRLSESQNAEQLRFIPGRDSDAIVAAKKLGASTVGSDGFLVANLEDTQLTVVDEVDVFADDQQWVITMAVTADGKYALLADTSAWSAEDHRIGVIRIDGSSLVSSPTISPLPYDFPIAIAISPWNNAFLLVTSYTLEDGYTLFGYDADNTTTPFVFVGEIDYNFGRPELPDSAVVVDRGSLTGHIYVSELSGVRHMRFLSNGTIEDLGYTEATGTNMGSMIGSIGIQP